jgi:hypothetical protein
MMFQPEQRRLIKRTYLRRVWWSLHSTKVPKEENPYENHL